MFANNRVTRRTALKLATVAAGLGGLSRQRGDEPDLDRIGGAYRERREQPREAKSQERSTM